jgi:hypothetical protein
MLSFRMTALAVKFKLKSRNFATLLFCFSWHDKPLSLNPCVLVIFFLGYRENNAVSRLTWNPPR